MSAMPRWTPELREAQRQRMLADHPLRGRSLSPETKAKMSLAQQARVLRGDKPPRPSAEANRRGGETRRGRKRSPEVRVKLALTLIKARDARVLSKTAPERAVSELLDRLGTCYLWNRAVKGIFHNWDFVLVAQRMLIEVDGCYWHGCERCGFGHRRQTKDARLETRARQLGWDVLRIREHELKDPLAVMDRLRGRLAASQAEGQLEVAS